jgi:hypothetical protein
MGADQFGKKMGPLRKIANGPDDSLRFQTFMHFLEGTSEEAYDKAAYKANDWILNYDKLGTLEKKVLQTNIPFYGWARYALKTGAKTFLFEPQRLSIWSKAYKSWEVSQGSNTPYTEAGLSDNQKWGTIPASAPESMQPPSQQKKIASVIDGWEKAGRPDPAKNLDEFTTLAMDTPFTFLLPVLDKTTNGNKRGMSALLYPVAGRAADYLAGKLTGSDFGGQPAPDLKSSALHLSEDYVGRFRRTFYDPSNPKKALYGMLTGGQQHGLPHF